MRLVHYLTLATAIALIAILYFAGKTVSPAKKTVLSAPAAMQPPSVSAYFFDSLLILSRKKLPDHAVAEIEAALSNFSLLKDSLAMIPGIDSLAGIWQEHKQLPVAAYYRAKAAKLEKSEKKLNFAGQFFLALLENAGSDELRIWEAQQAINCFQSSLEINPDDDTAKLALASGYIEGTGETMQGVQLLLGLVREKPEHIAANMMLGKLAVQSGQFDKALGRFETILKQQPQNTEALYFEAEAYRGKGEKEKAIAILEQCKKIINKPEFSRDIDNYIKTFK